MAEEERAALLVAAEERAVLLVAAEARAALLDLLPGVAGFSMLKGVSVAAWPPARRSG